MFEIRGVPPGPCEVSVRLESWVGESADPAVPPRRRGPAYRGRIEDLQSDEAVLSLERVTD